MKKSLFFNARIFNPHENVVYDWLLVQDGIITATGKAEERPEAGRGGRKIDLRGAVVIPAFTDAHVHLTMAALAHGRAQLKGCASLKEAIERLLRFSLQVEPGQWVQGGGFNKNLWPDGTPHRIDLDKIFPQNPVALFSVDMHSLWVNTLALKKSGLFSRSGTVAGGRIDRDERGWPTGLLYEKAMHPVLDSVPAVQEKETDNALREYVSYLHSLGITAVHTMETYDDYRLLQRLFDKKKERIRATVYVYHQHLSEMIKDNLHSYTGDRWLRLGGVKMFVDGSLGSRTAELFEPYESDRDNYGVEVLDESELNALVREAATNRLAAAVHAIGDRAVDKAVHAFAKQASLYKTYNLVPRIEHVQLIKPEIVPLFVRTGAVASVQPVHIADDVPLAERYWGKRSRYAFAYRRLDKAGITLAFGSDAPVADPDPLKGIFSAVHRRYELNPEEPVWQPQSVIDMQQALHAYTVGAARAVRQEAVRGTLTAGRQADFVVLSGNPFTANPQELRKLKVVLTVQDGTIVYSKESQHLY